MSWEIWEIAEMLATYLEAPLSQVIAWDRNVINRLLKENNTLSAFKLGCQQTRWDIYHSIKYADITGHYPKI